MLAVIHLKPGSVHYHMAQTHRPRLLAQAQDLNEQILEGIQVAASELTNSAAVGLLIAGQHAEGQDLLAGQLDLAGGDRAHAVGVEQEHRQPLC